MNKDTQNLLDRTLQKANKNGVLMWGFTVNPADGSIGTFCNQQLNLDSILFNTANACKELSEKHSLVATGNA